MICPCGSQDEYLTCCGRYHDGEAIPETAERLMRSRYSAYVKQNIGYLLKTHDPSTRQGFDALSAGGWARQADWKRLDIVSTNKGAASDTTGVVEFIAWYCVEGVLTCHHEVSDFIRTNAGWVYSDGTGKPASVIISGLKRFSPCPCGSGLKFGKCHRP